MEGPLTSAAPSRSARAEAGYRPPPAADVQREVARELRRLLDEAPFSTSYAFALVHALADLAVSMGTDSGDELRLPVRAIAERAVELYWPQVAPWPGLDEPLVQDVGRRGGTRRRAAVVRKVMEARREHGHDIGGLRARPREWQRLVSRVYRTVRHSALLQLQGGGELLFKNRVEGRGRRATITLEPGIACSLRNLHSQIVGIAQAAWIRFLREANPVLAAGAAPGGPAEGDRLPSGGIRAFLFPTPSTDLGPLAAPLTEAQRGRCLYCDRELGPDAGVDRFVPWATYPVELGHNLVAAHAECVAARQGHLPGLGSLRRWAKRIQSHAPGLEEAFASRGIPHPRATSLHVVQWAYRQARERREPVWAGGRTFEPLDDGWRDALRGRPASPGGPTIITARPAPPARRWIQDLVNRRPDELAAAMGDASGGQIRGPVRWLSPLEEDAHSEYSGEGFLRRLGVSLPIRPLDTFWPFEGPRWSALGTDGRDAVLLVDAAASLRDLVSAPTADGPATSARIGAALDEVTDHLRVRPSVDWTATFFGYTSRLAHLHLLHELNGVDAWLVSLYLVSDGQAGGPRSEAEWRDALGSMHRALGLTPLRRPGRAIDVFIHLD